MKRDVLTLGRWYVDVETESRFKLLRVVDDSAVEVVDEHGEWRLLSRWLWERDMRPIAREPVTPLPEQNIIVPQPSTRRRVEHVDVPVLRAPVVADVRDQIDPIVTCEKCGEQARERSTALVKGKRLCTTCL